MEIIAATKNQHKIKEIEEIVSNYGMKVISVEDAGIPDFEIEETGLTFEENSYIKAKTILEHSTLNVPVIADDSGLEVDVLGGEPGVRSARYAGVQGKDADNANNRKLLNKMKDVDPQKRTARFVSVITFLFPDGKKIWAEGVCEGKIATELMGDNGFGYDPLFIPDGYELSYAQIGPREKNKISHRARALEELSKKLSEK